MHDNARLYRTRQDTIRHNKAIPDKIIQYRIRQCNAIQYKTGRRDSTRHDKTKQHNAIQVNTRPDKTIRTKTRP